MKQIKAGSIAILQAWDFHSFLEEKAALLLRFWAVSATLPQRNTALVVVGSVGLSEGHHPLKADSILEALNNTCFHRGASVKEMSSVL